MKVNNFRGKAFMNINLTYSAQTRLLRTFILVLITSFCSWSAFAVRITIVQYEVKDMNEVGQDVTAWRFLSERLPPRVPNWF